MDEGSSLLQAVGSLLDWGTWGLGGGGSGFDTGTVNMTLKFKNDNFLKQSGFVFIFFHSTGTEISTLCFTCHLPLLTFMLALMRKEFFF